MLKKTVWMMAWFLIGAGATLAQDAGSDETSWNRPMPRQSAKPLNRLIRPSLKKKGASVQPVPTKPKDGFYPLVSTPSPAQTPTRFLDKKGKAVVPKVGTKSKKYSTLYQDAAPAPSR